MSSALAFIGAEFHPDEARDDHGRWVGDGAFLSSPSDALVSLSNGESATIAADDLHGVLLKAAKTGGPLDLTKLTIEGTPIFAGGLNRPRDTMPQIPSDHQERFLESLDQQHIGVKYESVRPMSLLPTQNEINAVRVGQKLNEYESGAKDLRPVMVSKDNYVLDGHHRWAVMVAAHTNSPKAGVKIPVIRIGADHTKALRIMTAYTKHAGIANRALELQLVGAWSPDQARDEQGRWTDGAGAIHYSGLGGHFSVKQQYQTDVHEVRVHNADGIRTVREYRDSYMAHAHAVQAAKGLRLAEGIEFIGAEFDEEKHPRDQKGQFTDAANDPYAQERADNQRFKESLIANGGVLYHGTTDAHAQKIVEEGLLSERERRGDEQGFDLYLSSTREMADAYATSRARKLGGNPAVYQVHVPPGANVIKAEKDDFLGHEGYAVTVRGKLPKESVIRVLAAAAGGPSPYKLSKFAAQHAAELVDAPKKERDAIRDEVRKALKNGEGPSGIADRLYGEIDKTPEEIDRIAQTEYVIARTGAKLEQFDAAAGDDADAGKQWVLGDTEHCPTCIELAGQTVPLGEPFVTADGEEFDGPPAHPNCDCDVEEADLSKTQARAAIRFVGAEFDEEKHPRDEKGQWASVADSIKNDTWFHGSTAKDLKAFSNDKIKGNDYDVPYTGVWASTNERTSPAMVNPRALYVVEPVKVDRVITRPEATKFARELQNEPDYQEKFAASGAKGTGDYARRRLLDAGYDVVLHRDKPVINETELERTGSTKFKLDWREHELRKEPLFANDPNGVQSYDLYRRGEHVTGYSSVKDLVDSVDREITILDADNARIKEQRPTPWKK